MIDAIKKIAESAGNTKLPCTFLFGTVVSTAPLSVQVDNRFYVDENTLVIPKHLREEEYNSHTHKLKISGADYTTEKTDEKHLGLNTGDKLALLREQGGQRFFVLGVV